MEHSSRLAWPADHASCALTLPVLRTGLRANKARRPLALRATPEFLSHALFLSFRAKQSEAEKSQEFSPRMGQ
jgi:hypothetical protein